MPIQGYTSITVKDETLLVLDSLIDKKDKTVKNRSRVVDTAVRKLAKVRK